MAKAGDFLENPFRGQTLTFRRTTAETAGELLEVESNWAGAGQEPPEHYHPYQEERFEMLEGELRAQVAGTEPALKTEAFFEMVWGLAQAAKANDKGSPSRDEAAAMMRDYADEFRLGRPDSE